MCLLKDTLARVKTVVNVYLLASITATSKDANSPKPRKCDPSKLGHYIQNIKLIVYPMLSTLF